SVPCDIAKRVSQLDAASSIAGIGTLTRRVSEESGLIIFDRIGRAGRGYSGHRCLDETGSL
ncbi:hypothetical protein, partial [Thauera butanivorans]|uniref:hypothetical protein n=1 Tax=Thauera butanivorans TaxID=86174 RepID=UPI001C3F4B21